MSWSRCVIVAVAFLAVTAIFGCSSVEQAGTKSAEEVKPPAPKIAYVVIVPPTETNPLCDIVPDPKEIEKDSNVRLMIVNLSGEELFVSFGDDIAEKTAEEEIENPALGKDEAWSVKLKTDKIGEFIYTVNPKQVDTCFPTLPNPKIVIP